MKKINLKKKLAAALAVVVALTSFAMPVSAADTAGESDTEILQAVGEEADPETEPETEGQDEDRASEVVYGTIDMPYAEYYYGELENLVDYDNYLQETTLPSEDAPVDKIGDTAISVEGASFATGYRDTGMYDAFTSASQSVTYGTTYYENLEDGGRLVKGNKAVQVAVNGTLYQNAKATIANEPELVNQYKFYEYIDTIQVAEEGTSYQEYKVLRADGTFSKMYAEAAELEYNADVEIDTSGKWAQYEIAITLPSDVVIDSDKMQGVVVETSDGKKYGMKHTDNLWRQAQLIGFSTIEGCVETKHKMPLQWQRFADMPGKTITKITYIMDGQADLVFHTDTKVKKFLNDSQGFTPQDTAYSNDGTNVQVEAFVPDDANYQLSNLASSTEEKMDTSLYTYDYSNNRLGLIGAVHPGAYTATFTDANGIYVDQVVEFRILSNMTADAVTVADNQLKVSDSVTTLAEYLNEITAITVNGTTTTAALGNLVFGTDGTILYDAVYSQRGSKTTIFPITDDGKGMYTVLLTASGFPEVTLELTKPSQDFEVTSSYTKAYGDAAFDLNAKADTNLTYVSSNSDVVSVDESGKVKINAAGNAVITISGEETSTHRATSVDVNITVNKAAGSVTATSSYNKTYGNGAFQLNAKATGALSYSSSNQKVAVVSGNGTVTIKGAGSAKITVKSAETDSYNAASKTITVNVAKAGQTISAKSYTKAYGSKAFSLGAKRTKGDGKVTYNSSNTKVATVSSTGKITIKGTGKATITITAAETSNYKKTTKKITITVKPKKATLSSVKSSTKKKAVVTWKKDSKASGYQIQYSISSSFKSGNGTSMVTKNSTVKKTLAGLKSGKKYYVRVRAYKTINGKKVYGAYSAPKTVTVK